MMSGFMPDFSSLFGMGDMTGLNGLFNPVKPDVINQPLPVPQLNIPKPQFGFANNNPFANNQNNPFGNITPPGAMPPAGARPPMPQQAQAPHPVTGAQQTPQEQAALGMNPASDQLKRDQMRKLMLMQQLSKQQGARQGGASGQGPSPMSPGLQGAARPGGNQMGMPPGLNTQVQSTPVPMPQRPMFIGSNQYGIR